MKNTRDTSLKQELWDDVYEAYLKFLKQLGEKATYMNKKTILYLFLDVPAPKFYISEHAARLIVNKKKISNQKLSERDEAFYKVFLQIKEKYAEYAELIPERYIIDEALKQPAPKFFLKLQRVRFAIKQGMLKEKTIA